MKKGITPIITMVLLVLVFTSLSYLFLTWSLEAEERFERASEEKTEYQVERTQTSYTIAEVYGENLSIKNKGKTLIHGDNFTFYLDDTPFNPVSSAGSMGKAQSGDFEFPVNLEDYEVTVIGPYDITDVLLPEISFIKINKHPEPKEFPKTQNTTIYIDLTGAHGLEQNSDYPVDITLLVDTSGSMTYGCHVNITDPGWPRCVSNCNGCPINCTNSSEGGADCRICGAKEAVSLFLNKLDPDNDRSSLVSFCSVANLEEGLTFDHQGVKSKVDLLEAGGGTQMAAAISIANQNSWRSDALKACILLTDGKPSSGGTEAAATEAAKKGIRIYTIGYMGGSPSHFNETLLKNVAEITNGKYYFASDTQVLNMIYDRILNEELLKIAGKEAMLMDYIPAHASYVPGTLQSSQASDNCTFYDNPGVDNITCELGDFLIGDYHRISFGLHFPNEGNNQLTNVYPDSRIEYNDYIDRHHVKVLPKTFVNVTAP